MYLVKGAASYTDDGFVVKDVLIDGVSISPNTASVAIQGATVIDAKNLLLIPGFIDVHTHLREPGFFYKESIASATAAAASAGYTALCAMPNLDPVPDCVKNLEKETDIIKRDAQIDVLPYGSITVGQKGEVLSDMDALAPYVFAFSDDGHGVQNDDIMLKAMLRAKRLGKAIVAHSEDIKLVNGGYIHDGKYAREHGHAGICSESEWGQLERDLKLVKETGCQYHVCHVSTKESVELIRKAKREGLNVSCETAPHYLTLTEDDLKEDGRFKMNPPVRTADDRDALIEGLNDGTVDMIATDHAPHSDEEKSKGLKDSLMGVIGLETAFPVLYTKLVKTNKISLHRLVEAMSVAPRRIFGLKVGAIKPKETANLAIIDVNREWTVHGSALLSKGSSTPFEGEKLYAKNLYTIFNGEIIWNIQEKN